MGSMSPRRHRSSVIPGFQEFFFFSSLVASLPLSVSDAILTGCSRSMPIAGEETSSITTGRRGDARALYKRDGGALGTMWGDCEEIGRADANDSTSDDNNVVGSRCLVAAASVAVGFCIVRCGSSF